MLPRLCLRPCCQTVGALWEPETPAPWRPKGKLALSTWSKPISSFCSNTSTSTFKTESHSFPLEFHTSYHSIRRLLTISTNHSFVQQGIVQFKRNSCSKFNLSVACAPYLSVLHQSEMEKFSFWIHPSTCLCISFYDIHFNMSIMDKCNLCVSMEVIGVHSCVVYQHIHIPHYTTSICRISYCQFLWIYRKQYFFTTHYLSSINCSLAIGQQSLQVEGKWKRPVCGLCNFLFNLFLTLWLDG